MYGSDMFVLPPGFVTVRDAYETLGSGKLCNVIAVVVYSRAPVKTVKDWTVEITLSDHSGFPGLGAPFRFFHAVEDRLPPFGTGCENGDVVIIRNMKVLNFKGALGLTNKQTEWAVISGSELLASTDENFDDVPIVRSTGSKPGHPNVAELLYGKQIREVIDPSTIQRPAPRSALEVANTITAVGGVAPKPKNKFSLVKDITPPTYGEKIFKDLFGEVRRIFKTDSRMSIYITDYTSHDLLYNYIFGDDDEGPDGDRFGYVKDAAKTWPGPHGKKTILVTLWDAHAVFAHKELCEGQYVHLRNVHLTMDKNGGMLEGHCRGDKWNMERINVTIVKPVEADSNEYLRELLRRKRATEIAEGAKFVRDPSNMKRRAEVMLDITNDQTVNSNTARNKKRQGKKSKRNPKGANITEDSDCHEPKPRPEKRAVFSANTEVRILKVEVPCKSISQIIDPRILARKTPKGNVFFLPFQNCRYKSQVRVVDFSPNNLADFAVPSRDSHYGMLSDQDDSDSEVDMMHLNDRDVRWKWRFFLVVEDASRASNQQPARMELLVFDDEGEYLLNMHPCNLRKDPRALTQLKEKLFVLWGDLQELKEEASISQKVPERKLHSRPFECLISEYGIEARDEHGIKKDNGEYERVFHLSGTTIK